MGAYVNPGNSRFRSIRNSGLFVDKSGLIRLVNMSVGTEDRRILFCRPTGFGKSTDLSMLAAYYSCGCNSRELFHGLAIEQDASFEEHLNRHNVLFLDVEELYRGAVRENRLEAFPRCISEAVNAELAVLYPDEIRGHEHSLAESLPQIHAVHGASFIFLLDGWDVIYREAPCSEELKRDYLIFLRGLFKDSILSECIELVYMTGILPIPEHVLQSGLNNFREYTVLQPLSFAQYVGFTEAEVSGLCQEHQLPLQELRDWCAWCRLDSVGCVYRPAGVVQALRRHMAESSFSLACTAAQMLERMGPNVKDEFQKTVQDLLAGKAVSVLASRDRADLSRLDSLDSILSALVYLGFLSYQDGKVCIPNQEAAAAFLAFQKENNG